MLAKTIQPIAAITIVADEEHQKEAFSGIAPAMAGDFTMTNFRTQGLR